MEKKYNFSTAISLVVGIVIGSGIFFKADDVLAAVNGNILLGVLGFLIVGIGVLFGALTVSYYTNIDKENIGLIGYARLALGKKFAFVVGWFSIACYFPAIIFILAMVASIYLGVLLGIDNYIFQTIATAIFLISAFVINVKSPEAGGKVQVLFTVAKLIPLILIGFIGTFFFSSTESLSAIAEAGISGGTPLTALIIIAFAFDGWIVATSIARDLENSSKNLPKALAFGTLIIVIVYILYFFGVTQILDPTTIIEQGDAHTQLAAQQILGPLGGKIITAFVVISVCGGLNGMVLAYIRLPKVCIDAGIIRNFFGTDEESTKRGMLLFCSVIVAIIFTFNLLVDLGIIFSNLSSPFDVSSLPILINQIVYTCIFLCVNKHTKNESIGKRCFYLITSLIAAITCGVVIYGSLSVNGLLYIIISVVICLIGIPFYNREN